jgi:hypothetical protein
MRKMTWASVADFEHRHKEGLELFAMAAIVTMRKTLPWPFCLVPPLEWAWEWLRDALLTLLSLKGPLPHAAESQSSERVTRAADGTVESVKESTVSGAAPLVQPMPEDDSHHGA